MNEVKDHFISLAKPRQSTLPLLVSGNLSRSRNAWGSYKLARVAQDLFEDRDSSKSLNALRFL
jgi:hypothetical protein